MAILSGCASTARTPTDAQLSSVAWMAGTWANDDAGNSSEEHWTEPRGGTMFGINREVRNGQTAFFEYLCIEHTPDGIFYLASPKGRQPPTPFKLVESGDYRAIFENPEHDFPQRIIYWREGDLMHARIEGNDKGTPHTEEWTWKRTKSQ